MTSTTPIVDLYTNVLGRAPDEEGLQNWRNALAGGMSVGDIRNQFLASDEYRQNQMVNQLPQNVQTAVQGPGSDIPTGLYGSETALNKGLADALAALVASQQETRELLSPYTTQGTAAMQQQAALTGAQGVEAQQAAYDAFAASPGQQYLQQQAEKALMRNAAKMGGLGGGNVRNELQAQAIGMAQQDFADQFNRLGQVAQMGLAGAGQQANLAQGYGTGQANLQSGMAQQIAGGRTAAGDKIAQAIGQTGQGLANLAQQQGTGFSQIVGTQGGNLANILSGAGQAQGQSGLNLAQILANISSGASSGLGIQGIPGVQQTTGALGGIGSLASGIGAFGTGWGFGGKK